MLKWFERKCKAKYHFYENKINRNYAKDFVWNHKITRFSLWFRLLFHAGMPVFWMAKYGKKPFSITIEKNADPRYTLCFWCFLTSIQFPKTNIHFSFFSLSLFPPSLSLCKYKHQRFSLFLSKQFILFGQNEKENSWFTRRQPRKQEWILYEKIRRMMTGLDKRIRMKIFCICV